MTAEQLGAIAGVVLSLAFSYIPGVREKFGALETVKKSLVMALMLLGVAAGAFALSCAAIVVSVECSQAGAVGLVNVYLAALVTNQATYMLSPQIKPVQ